MSARRPARAAAPSAAPNRFHAPPASGASRPGSAPGTSDPSAKANHPTVERSRVPSSTTFSAIERAAVPARVDEPKAASDSSKEISPMPLTIWPPAGKQDSLPNSTAHAHDELGHATPTPAVDPVAARIRSRRLALGWSLKRLSEAAGGLAPSFLFNIENGRKVPSEEVAVRIARALEDDAHEATYRAWALAKSRGRAIRRNHLELQAAWDLLRTPFGEPAQPYAENHEDGHHDTEAARNALAAAAEAGPIVRMAPDAREATRLSVPVLEAGADPGDGVRPPAALVINTLKLDPTVWGRDAARAREHFARLRRPFAFVVDAAQAVRSPRLIPGYIALVTRDAAAIEDGTLRPEEAYVVRLNGRLEVASGAALRGEAVLPQPLASAPAASWRAHVLGRVDMLLPGL